MGLAALRPGPGHHPAGDRQETHADRLRGHEPLGQRRRLRPACLPQEQRARRLLFRAACPGADRFHRGLRPPAERRRDRLRGHRPRRRDGAAGPRRPRRAGADPPGVAAVGSPITRHGSAVRPRQRGAVHERGHHRARARAAGAVPGRERHRGQLHVAGSERAADLPPRPGIWPPSGPAASSSMSPATRAWASLGEDDVLRRAHVHGATTSTTTPSTTAPPTCGTPRAGRSAKRAALPRDRGGRARRLGAGRDDPARDGDRRRGDPQPRDPLEFQLRDFCLPAPPAGRLHALPSFRTFRSKDSRSVDPRSGCPKTLRKARVWRPPAPGPGSARSAAAGAGPSNPP